jgi:hypothetical protein
MKHIIASQLAVGMVITFFGENYPVTTIFTSPSGIINVWSSKSGINGGYFSFEPEQAVIILY